MNDKVGSNEPRQLDDIIAENEAIRLEILKIELADKSKPQKDKKTIDPVLATIFVALIGFLGTTAVSVYSAKNERNLKQREFEYNLITKALEQPTKSQQISLLKFIDTLKLIKDEEIAQNLKTQLKNPNNIPSISTKAVIDSNYIPIKVDPIFKTLTGPASAIALKVALSEVNASETSDSTGGLKMIDKYFLHKNSRREFGGWGCAFVSWCYAQNTSQKPPFSYTGTFMELVYELKSKGMYVNTTKGMKAGDIYFIRPRFTGDNAIHFGGIVESINSGYFIAIHANLSNAKHPIFRQKVKISDVIGYGRIK